MHPVARARLVLARRPWIHWATTITLAGAVAFVVQDRLTEVERARDAWGRTTTVYVASRAHEPGDALAVHPAEVPEAMVPSAAITDHAEGATVRQRMAQGEIVTDVDLVARPGLAAGAPAGTVVVAVAGDPARYLPIGSQVQISADGMIVADTATVTGVVDDVAFVAVDRSVAAAVAAAEQAGLATILLVP
jgi:hypothetical protein